MTKSNKRKLYRSREDKILAGIFGGLGEYFDIDSNLLRLIGLLVLVLTAFVPFLIIYFVAMFIIPSDREKNGKEGENEDKGENYSCSPAYKKWWFWLIIAIMLFPLILMILGFFLFTARTDVIEIREERIIVEPSGDDFDYIKIQKEE
jgi:phage shock protein C